MCLGAGDIGAKSISTDERGKRGFCLVTFGLTDLSTVSTKS